jgi:DNA-binding LytR/AlgR family response regulator
MHNTRSVAFSVSNAPGTGLQIPSFRSFCQSWIVAPYLIAVIVLTLPALLQPASTEEAGNLISLGLAAERTGPWQPARLDALVLPDNHAWLRAVFTVPLSGLAADSPPLGLYLSGTFSARVIWNGQEVGHKGEPAVSREGEIPGPVDAIIHLPAEILSPGNNTALIELSSHFRQNSLNSILHGGDALPGLRLASYSSEVRRPISYYAAPLITFVLLAVAAFVLLTVTAHQRTRALVLVAALMISAATEIFRAFYAYPYSWHMLRLGLLASAALVFACALPFYTAARAGVSLPTWLLPTLVVAGIAAILWVGPPQDVVHGVLWLCVPISIAFAIRATRRGISDSAMLLGALVCLMISLLLDSGRFFDQYLYVAVIPLMAALCRPKPARPLPLPEKTEPARLIVHSAGRQRVIDINEILAIQGAGNYAEIKLAGGETVLDDRSLKALLTLLPASFVRVHRSHLANLDDVTELRSLGAGKYELLLSRGQRCPVSRAQVQRIRDQLGLAQRADA